VIKINRQIIIVPNAAHFLPPTAIVIFRTIPEHTDAFVPSWHKFKYSISVDIGLLLSQPFMISDFHLLVLWNR